VANKIFKYAKKFLPLIGIIILIYLVFRLDVEKIKDAFLSIQPIYILFSLSLTIPALFFRNYSWQLVQKEQKIKLSFIQSLKILLIGSFYAIFTPGFLGHLIRVPYMKEKTGEPYGKLFVNVFIEVTLRTTVVILMMLAGSLLILGMFSQIFVYIILIVVIWLLLLLYFIKRERGERLFNSLIKYFLPNRLKDSSYKFVNTFYTDFPKIRRLIIPLVVGTFAIILVNFQIYLFVMALGINIPYLYFLLLTPIATIISFLPITVAGLGTRELTSVWLFSTLFAAPKEGILVVTILGFLATDIFEGFLGFLVSLTEADGKDVKDIETMIVKD